MKKLLAALAVLTFASLAHAQVPLTYVKANPAYFITANTVTRFVNPSTGLNTNDGLTTGTAWLTVQRALDDIPDGYTTLVVIKVAAGTISTAQAWVHHAAAGGVAGGPNVNIQGDCTTPQATFTTTGAGAAVVANGVTKMAQVTFTPTVATGSVPGVIADADFFFQQTAATGLFTVRAILASVGPAVVMNTSSTAAVSTLTPTLCPWATVVTGSTNITSLHYSGIQLQNLVVRGIKFTSLASVNSATLQGVYVTGGGTSFRNGVLQPGNYIAGTSVFDQSGVAINGMSTSVVTGVQQINGAFGVITTMVFKGSANPKLALGASVNGQSFGATVKSIQTSDFEGSGTAIRMMNSGLADTGAMSATGSPPTCGASGALTMDITGSPLVMDYGSRYVVCSTHTGKYTVASQVRSGSSVSMISSWGLVNTVLATDEWVVGAAGTKAAADLPVTDAVELVRVSNAAF